MKNLHKFLFSISLVLISTNHLIALGGPRYTITPENAAEYGFEILHYYREVPGYHSFTIKLEREKINKWHKEEYGEVYLAYGNFFDDDRNAIKIVRSFSIIDVNKNPKFDLTINAFDDELETLFCSMNGAYPAGATFTLELKPFSVNK